MQIALLHDLLEDCPDWTMDRLISEGFSPIVVVAISRLTHVGNVEYQKYIESIYENPVATIVKMADLEDNMDILRLSALQEKDVARLNKYLKAYNYLKKANY